MKEKPFLLIFFLQIFSILTFSTSSSSNLYPCQPPSISHLMEDTITYFHVPDRCILDITFHHIWMEGISTFKIFDESGMLYKNVTFSDYEGEERKSVSLKAGLYKMAAYGTGFSYDLKFYGKRGNWGFVVACFPNKGIFRLSEGESVRVYFKVKNKTFNFFTTEEFEPVERIGFVEVYDDKNVKRATFQLISSNLDESFQKSEKFNRMTSEETFWSSIMYGGSNATAKLGLWTDENSYNYPTGLCTLITPQPDYYFIPEFRVRNVELNIKDSLNTSAHIGAAGYPNYHTDEVFNLVQELSLKTFNKYVSWRWREGKNGNSENDDNNPFHINWDGFDFEDFDERLSHLEKYGISPILTLEWSSDCFLSRHPALWNKNDMEEYAEFCLATVIHCVAPDLENPKTFRKPFEIAGIQLLGEPNILLEEKIEENSAIEQYIEILKTVSHRIKSYPDLRVRSVKIIGPGIGSDEHGDSDKFYWISKILRAAGNYIDIISWDEYYKWLLEEVEGYGKDALEMKNLIGNEGYNKEICMSEFNLMGGIPTSQYFFGSRYSELYLFGAISRSINCGMKYPVYFSLVDSWFEPRLKGLISSQPMPPYSTIPYLTRKPQFYSMEITGEICRDNLLNITPRVSQLDCLASFDSEDEIFKVGISNRYEGTSIITLKLNSKFIKKLYESEYPIEFENGNITMERKPKNFVIRVYNVSENSINLLYIFNSNDETFNLVIPPWSIYYVEITLESTPVIFN